MRSEHGFDDVIHCSECRTIVGYALRGAGCIPSIACTTCKEKLDDSETREASDEQAE